MPPVTEIYVIFIVVVVAAAADDDASTAADDDDDYVDEYVDLRYASTCGVSFSSSAASISAISLNPSLIFRIN